MPSFDAHPGYEFVGVAIAAALYVMTYLSVVRTLRYPRNWARLSFAALSPAITMTFLMLVHTSMSSAGLDIVTLCVLAGFISVLFYIISAPALAFKPASRPTEFLARHGEYAGLWMLVPAVAAVITIPNAKLHAIVAVAMTIELAWYLQYRWTKKERVLIPITGRDLAVLKMQANGDIKSYARRHGISELELTGDEVAWRGCEKTSSHCPLNLYVNRLGLNTTPCCREHMRVLCLTVSTWMEELGIVYWLEGGTLLGAVREGGTLLPWEDDVDVSVLIEDDAAWDALAIGVAACGERDGYLVDAFKRNGFIAITHAASRLSPLRWENNRLRGEVRLDLTTYRPGVSQGERVIERRPSKGRMPPTESGGYGVARDLVLPTSRVTFLGRELCCPRQPEEYLRVLYGDFKQVDYSYVDTGPAAARRDLDVTARATTTN